MSSSRVYDYVVVGGGTAGLVVAARLSENPDISVCVVEAGKDHSTNVDTMIPGTHLSRVLHPTCAQIFLQDSLSRTWVTRKSIGCFSRLRNLT